MERRFDDELRQLNERLFTMAGMAERSVGKAIKALVDRDPALALAVVEEDAAINRLEVEIEEACVSLLARHRPAASDLRFVAMAFKLVNDLERVGDLAVNIGQRALDLVSEPPVKPLVDIPKMAAASQKMLDDALQAFVNRDADLARDVCRRDSEVDHLNDLVHDELLVYMTRDPATVRRAVDLILIARHLERVADHATNIAEDAYYLVHGSTMKHHLAGE